MKTREHEVNELKLKLANLETQDEKLKMIWDWIHIKKINLNQFKVLINSTYGKH